MCNFNFSLYKIFKAGHYTFLYTNIHTSNVYFKPYTFSIHTLNFWPAQIWKIYILHTLYVYFQIVYFKYTYMVCFSPANPISLGVTFFQKQIWGRWKILRSSVGCRPSQLCGCLYIHIHTSLRQEKWKIYIQHTLYVYRKFVYVFFIHTLYV